MIRSNSDTTTSAASPTPISPFSNYSVPSEPTSEETPDLGAFNTILHEWIHLQPAPRTTNATLAMHSSTTSRTSNAYRLRSHSSTTHDHRTSDFDSDSDLRGGSTVWAHRPIASYLSLDNTSTTDTETDIPVHNAETSSSSRLTSRSYTSTLLDVIRNPQPIASRASDTEGEQGYRTVEIDEISELDFNPSNFDETYDDNVHEYDDANREENIIERMADLKFDDTADVEEEPSLGYLDEALKFIAAERERWNAHREALGSASAGAVDGKSGLEPRRKRRRKRTKTPRAHSPSHVSMSVPPTSTIAQATLSSNEDQAGEDADADADSSSSSYDRHYSTPTTGKEGYSSKSAPGSPRRKERGSRRRRSHFKGMRRLRNARSTPQLNLGAIDKAELGNETDDSEESPRVTQMKGLAKKLAKLFPEDKKWLDCLTLKTLSPSQTPLGYFASVAEDSEAHESSVLSGFVDTRGPSPKDTDNRIIHVFVDHSNILIGLLNYLKRYPRQHPQYRNSATSQSATPQSSVPGSSNTSTPGHSYPKPPKHLSHSALTLILERGRPVTRRVLVTSSPLYQPMESAEKLGYDVRIFARVPDMGGDNDRDKRPGSGHVRSISASTVGSADPSESPVKVPRWRSGSINNGNAGNGRKKAHSRRVSGTSTENEQSGAAPNFPYAIAGSLGSPTNGPSSVLSSSLPSNIAAVGSPSNGNGPARIKFREQGVDELLQLKLHQALASIDGPPPPDSTIILATGDGNAGEFNEDGFLGGVRTALRRGWRVELYAWEGGLSRAWKREFGEGSEWGSSASDGPRFRVIGMEQFGSELVEVYY